MAQWHDPHIQLLQLFGLCVERPFDDFKPVREFVPVAPGRRYRLRLSPLPAETPAVDGLAWMVYDVAGKALPTVPGGDGWLTFASHGGGRPIEIVRLGRAYQRPLGATRLAGSFTIASVQLEAAP